MAITGRSWRAVVAAARGLAALAIVGAFLALAPAAFADTASNPPPAEPPNTLVLAIIALGVLGAVLLLTRPKRGPR